MGSSVDDLPAESEMRRMLADAGVHLNNDASYSAVVREYKASFDGGVFDIDFGFEDVKYPLEGPEIFINSNNILSSKTQTTMMKDVSALIIEENLCPSIKADFIGIMASLVDIRIGSNNNDKKCVHWRRVMAENIILFANGSRVHEG